MRCNFSSLLGAVSTLSSSERCGQIGKGPKQISNYAQRESMTYEEAGEEFTVFSLSLLGKKPKKTKKQV